MSPCCWQYTANAIAALESDLQQIHDRVQGELKARLAQIPSDGGGGAAGGAAAGALFGSIAGNAGLGAGIGSGVGLISGVAYDQVSKDNDKKEYQREVAAQNANNLDECAHR